MTLEQERDVAIAHRADVYLRVLEMADRSELFMSVNGGYRQVDRRAITPLAGADWMAFDDLQIWGFLTEDVWPGKTACLEDGVLSLHTVILTRDGRDLLGHLRWRDRPTQPNT